MRDSRLKRSRRLLSWASSEATSFRPTVRPGADAWRDRSRPSLRARQGLRCDDRRTPCRCRGLCVIRSPPAPRPLTSNPAAHGRARRFARRARPRAVPRRRTRGTAPRGSRGPPARSARARSASSWSAAAPTVGELSSTSAQRASSTRLLRLGEENSARQPDSRGGRRRAGPPRGAGQAARRRSPVEDQRLAEAQDVPVLADGGGRRHAGR